MPERADDTGPGAAPSSEEAPTIPPPPKRGPGGLRWRSSATPVAAKPWEQPWQEATAQHERDEKRPAAQYDLLSHDVEATMPARQLGEAVHLSGPRRPRYRAGLVLGTLVALALLMGGLVWAIAYDLGSGPAHPSRLYSLQRLAPEVAFGDLLAQEARAEALAEAASALRGACSPAAPGSRSRGQLVAEEAKAAASSGDVLHLVAALAGRFERLRGGGRLVALLRKLARSSLAASLGYEMWLEDLEATGCYSAPTNDVHFYQAKRASAAAAREQAALKRAWAPARAADRRSAGERASGRRHRFGSFAL
jgi:hypothetical protein